MKVIILMVSSLLCFVTWPSQAQGYERNTARSVNQVVFGQVQTLRRIDQQAMMASAHQGWKTLGGAVIGGLVGHQFGGGRGQDVATLVGALAGATLSERYQDEMRVVEQQLVELLIEDERGALINVIQDYDSRMIFAQGDKVRILYFDDGVRVDKSY